MKISNATCQALASASLLALSTVLCATPALSATSVTSKISRSNDDGVELSNGKINVGDQALKIGLGNTVGLRFKLNIGKGTKISSAKLNIVAALGDSGSSVATIWAEDTDNASGISSKNRNLTSRSKTGKKVTWNMPGFRWKSTVSSIDISDVIQEVVSRKGWKSGNYLMIMMQSRGDDRDFMAFEGRGEPIKLELELGLGSSSVGGSSNDGGSSGGNGGGNDAPDDISIPHSSGASCLKTSKGTLIDVKGTKDRSVRMYRVNGDKRIDLRDAKLFIGAGGVHGVVLEQSKGDYCISGGVYHNGLKDGDPWDAPAGFKFNTGFHQRGGVYMAGGNNAIVENATMLQVGDGIAVKEMRGKVIFRNSYIRHAGDDTLETDRGTPVTIDNVLADWSYTGISCRREGDRKPPNGAKLEIVNSLIAMRPGSIRNFWKITGPKEIKAGESERTIQGCKFYLQNNTFLLENYVEQGNPAAYNYWYDALDEKSCKNNTIVVRNAKKGQLETFRKQKGGECFTFTDDMRVWEKARDRWFDKNSQFKQFKNQEPKGR